jgi:glycosyltransferase involved in cell wall biosynthesis
VGFVQVIGKGLVETASNIHAMNNFSDSDNPCPVTRAVTAIFQDEFSLLHVGKFYPPHRGGMEAHLRDLAVRQRDLCSVRVIVANSVRRNHMSEVEGVPVLRVASLGSVGSMPVCPGLTVAIRNSPADLVHMHMPNPGAAYAYLKSGHTGKVVLTHHADTLGKKFLRRFSDPYVNRLMRRAVRIIATSHRYLDSSYELAPFREKCRVIPLGIGIEPVSDIDRAMGLELRREHGGRLILAVGRLVPYKGFDFLIRALKSVDAKLMLIGAGPQSEYLARLAVSEGVDNKLIMLGPVENLAPYFAAACIFVLPSSNRAEAFGIVQLEAMAAGLPVINTNIDSAVPEVCINGKTGITIQPGDTDALAAAMKRLLDNEGLRHQLGQAAKTRVCAEFRADTMAERVLALYREVLNGG